MTEYFTGNYKRCIRTQPIRVSDAILPDPASPKNTKAFACAALVGIGMVFGMFVVTGMKSCEKPQQLSDCMTCHRKVAYTKYFQGSLDPQAMATAVLATKSPKLLAAMHVAGEKRSPHTSRKGGRGGKYGGAWQTGPHFGKVPDSVTEQALIAELAIGTHFADAKGDMVKALNGYGGDKTKKQYAYNVLRELEENVP